MNIWRPVWHVSMIGVWGAVIVGQTEVADGLAHVAWGRNTGRGIFVTLTSLAPWYVASVGVHYKFAHERLKRLRRLARWRWDHTRDRYVRWAEWSCAHIFQDRCFQSRSSGTCYRWLGHCFFGFVARSENEGSGRPGDRWKGIARCSMLGSTFFFFLHVHLPLFPLSFLPIFS